MSILKGLAAFTATIIFTSSASAASLTTFSDQSAFEAALDQSFTRIDFDDSAFYQGGSISTPVTAGDARFAAVGLDVINPVPGFTTFLVNATNYPAAIGGPSVAMFNGNSTSDPSDDFAVNFQTPVNGFGYAPNRIDRGQILLYSGEDLTGTLLGIINNDGSGSFVGGISDMLIRSAQITCTFDQDYICGITDLQFGTTAAPVPLPAAGWMLLAGMAGLMGLRRRMS